MFSVINHHLEYMLISKFFYIFYALFPIREISNHIILYYCPQFEYNHFKLILILEQLDMSWAYLECQFVENAANDYISD